MGILIDEAKCIGCGLCEYSCAYNAIEVDRKARADNDRCTDCTVCVDYCPVDAIAMEAPLPARAAMAPGEATFDVVVIGGGVGGLCAGALLAHRGYKTLVLERYPSVGGRYSSLKHKGVMVPTGGSIVQVGSPIEEVFREVGASFDVVVPELLKYWIRGKGWIDPGPGRGQFRRVLALASGEPEVVDRVMASMRAVFQGQQYPSGSTLEWLRPITDNKDIEGIFRTMAAIAFGAEDGPASSFFSILGLSAGKGVGLARRGGIRLMGELAKAIIRKGGQVWTRSKVQAIVLEDGEAVGVLAERRGQTWRVRGRVFISNAGPKQTARLIGPGNLDPQYLAYLDETVIPICGPSFHVLSDRSLLGEYPGFVHVVGGRRICILFDATDSVPWGSPGTHIIEMYGFVPPDPHMHEDPEVIVQETAQDLDDIFPGWRQHGELKIGFLDEEWPGSRAWAGQGATVETPIPNLFLVGDGCLSRKGYFGATGAAESAQWTAELVQERFPPGAG